jgi:hypothetical protein
MTFFFYQGFANTYAYLSGDLYYYITPEWVARAAGFAVLGNLCLWIGYFWAEFRDVGANVARRIYERTQRQAVRPRLALICLFFLAGLAIRLYSVRIGIGGYFSDPTAREAALSYSQFLYVMENIGTLALVAYFCVLLQGQGRGSWLVFGLMFTVEIASIILIGFKGQVVYRFYYLAVAYVFARGRLPKGLVVSGLVALLIVTPINLFARALYNTGRIKTGDLSQIASGFASASRALYNRESAVWALGQSFQGVIEMNAQLEPAAMVMRHVDENDIRFYGADYASIFTWTIPRAIWPSKPNAHKGSWVRTEVYHRTPGSSAPQSVPGDFYMNFGPGGILVGFFLMGLLQRGATVCLRAIRSQRYLPLIPFAVFFLSQPQSDVGPHIAMALKELLIFSLVLAVLFPRIQPAAPAGALASAQ